MLYFFWGVGLKKGVQSWRERFHSVLSFSTSHSFTIIDLSIQYLFPLHIVIGYLFFRLVPSLSLSLPLNPVSISILYCHSRFLIRLSLLFLSLSLQYQFSFCIVIVYVFPFVLLSCPCLSFSSHYVFSLFVSFSSICFHCVASLCTCFPSCCFPVPVSPSQSSHHRVTATSSPLVRSWRLSASPRLPLP